MNIHLQLTDFLTAWLWSCQATRRLITVEKSQKKKSARLILRFETLPRPCSTSASGQAGGTTMGKLLSERHYRCLPNEGLPSWAVMVTLSQQRSYCNNPAIWHSSFSMPFQKLNLPHNEFKIVVSVCFFAVFIIPLTSAERTKECKTFLLTLSLVMPNVQNKHGTHRVEGRFDWGSCLKLRT